MRKIRVAHVLYSFGIGGLEKGVATLVKNASKPFEHIIVCLDHSGDSERLLPAKTIVLEMCKPPGNSIRFLNKLSQTLKDLHPDVVHTRNWGGTDGVIAARIAGIKVVVHGEHGFDADNPTGRKILRVWFYKFLSRWISEYTCVSKPLENWLQKVVRVEKPITQIYNGVDTESYRLGAKEPVRRKLGIPDEAFVVGSVGRLAAIKNYPTLISAFHKVHQYKPGAMLLIAGDGPDRENLESLAGPGVVFLGERLDVPNLLCSFDVFALSSYNEGISNTILEAMATGLPVVASKVGGNPEMVIDGVTGKLFPSGNVEVLASILMEYSRSPSLRFQHGNHGRQQAIDRFSVNSMVATYESIWERVAEG